MSAPFRWPQGRRCAVALTYDDALPVHYEHVGPQLEAHGLRGTFYLNIAADPTTNPAHWRELGERGHELGNHTLFHPCRRYRSRRGWLDKSFDLRSYTGNRLRLELGVANAFLHLLDDKRERTFAHTCHETHLGRLWNKTSISDLVRNEFVAARAMRTDRPVVVSRSLDLMRLECYGADGSTFGTLRDHICGAQDDGGCLILTFHGVGKGTHGLFVDPSVHEELLDWLAGQGQFWVSPLINVAKWIRDWQIDTPPALGPTHAEPHAEPH